MKECSNCLKKVFALQSDFEILYEKILENSQDVKNAKCDWLGC